MILLLLFVSRFLCSRFLFSNFVFHLPFSIFSRCFFQLTWVKTLLFDSPIRFVLKYFDLICNWLSICSSHQLNEFMLSDYCCYSLCFTVYFNCLLSIVGTESDFSRCDVDEARWRYCEFCWLVVVHYCSVVMIIKMFNFYNIYSFFCVVVTFLNQSRIHQKYVFFRFVGDEEIFLR